MRIETLIDRLKGLCASDRLAILNGLTEGASMEYVEALVAADGGRFAFAAGAIEGEPFVPVDRLSDAPGLCNLGGGVGVLTEVMRAQANGELSIADVGNSPLTREMVRTANATDSGKRTALGQETYDGCMVPGPDSGFNL